MRKLMILIGMIVLISSMFLVHGAAYPEAFLGKLDCGDLKPLADAYGELKCPVIVKHRYSTPQTDFEPFCIEEYCPNADQSLCRCTKMKYPPHPTAAVSIVSNIDAASAGASVTTLTGSTGITEEEIILGNINLLEYRRVFETAFNISGVGSTGADELYLDILGKKYEDEITLCQSKINDLNKSLNEEKDKTFLLEEELNQSRKDVEELKFNFTTEINQLKERIRFSGITGFFIRMFD